MASKIKIGIIGGTGLEADFSPLENIGKVDLKETPYGFPSQTTVTSGEIAGVSVLVMGRHGPDHSISPSNVNYRANLWSLKEAGCTHLLVTTACGSLKEHIKPGAFGILDQTINRTSGSRQNSFYRVCHIPLAKPFDATLQKIFAEACREHAFEFTENVTAVCIEGPAFSTLAESNLYRSWNCDIVNMTCVPEAQLANELGLIYGSIALITDYDCWHNDENETVNVKLVTERLIELKRKASIVLETAVKKCAQIDWTDEIQRRKEICDIAIMCK